MTAYDKKLHIIVGFLISLLGYYLFTSLLAGFVLAALAGMLKEVIDKITGKGTPELMDFIATIIGGLLVILTYGII